MKIVPMEAKKKQQMIVKVSISVVGFGPKSHYRDLIGRTALNILRSSSIFEIVEVVFHF